MGFSPDHLRRQLQAMRLGRGARLIVHASLKSIGPIPGGPASLLALFQETIGAEGLLAMPVFTYSFAGQTTYPPFDPEAGVSRTGALTEVFRTRPGTVRSLHPTHSVAAWGREAAGLVAGHERRTALGKDSPFHRLADREARILLIGCGFTSLSLIHVGEVLAGVYYRDRFCWRHAGWKPRARVMAPGGRVREIAQREVPGCSASFDRLEPLARGAGWMSAHPLGMAVVTVLPARPLLDLIVRVLRRDPDFLLCPTGVCPACDARRRPYPAPRSPGPALTGTAS